MQIAFFPGPAAVTNPYLSLVAGGIDQLGETVTGYRISDPFQTPDILHVHWPESLYMERFVRRSGLLSRLAFKNLLATADRVKRKGGKLVWTAHNLKPHEPPAARHRATWEEGFAGLLERLDTTVCMSQYAADLVRQTYPHLNGDIAVIPHPHYGDFYRPDQPREITRAELGLYPGQRLLVSVGLIRRYKNIPALIESFRCIARPGEKLLVAGQCYDADLMAELEAARAGDPRVSIVNKTLSDGELANCYKAADAAVSNGDGILNSGAVLTAISLGVPVIAPGVGSTPEFQSKVGDQWCVTFKPPLTPELLRDAMDKAALAEGAPDLSSFEPLRVGRLHLDAYRGAPAHE